MTLREAAKQALDALNNLWDSSDIHPTVWGDSGCYKASESLRAALAQPESEQTAVFNDTVTYGMGVSIGGVRIDPKDMYRSPKSEPASDREALIAGLKAELANFAHNKTLETLLLDSVDMLEADAQPESESVPKSQRQEAYASIDRLLRNRMDDEEYAYFSTSLDTLYAGAQQVAYVPLTSVQISIAAVESGITRSAPDEEIETFTRAIEQAVRGKL